jgi:hypothetical protein
MTAAQTGKLSPAAMSLMGYSLPGKEAASPSMSAKPPKADQIPLAAN